MLKIAYRCFECILSPTVSNKVAVSRCLIKGGFAGRGAGSAEHGKP